MQLGGVRKGRLGSHQVGGCHCSLGVWLVLQEKLSFTRRQAPPRLHFTPTLQTVLVILFCSPQSSIEIMGQKQAGSGMMRSLRASRIGVSVALVGYTEPQD